MKQHKARLYFIININIDTVIFLPLNKYRFNLNTTE